MRDGGGGRYVQATASPSGSHGDWSRWELLKFFDSERANVQLLRSAIVDGEEVPNVSIYYFDSENFVPIMVHEEVMSGPGKGMIMESRMSDYQEVEGLYIPFSMTQGVKDQPGQPINITSVELNPSVDESEFKFPESTEE